MSRWFEILHYRRPFPTSVPRRIASPTTSPWLLRQQLWNAASGPLRCPAADPSRMIFTLWPWIKASAFGYRPSPTPQGSSVSSPCRASAKHLAVQPCLAPLRVACLSFGVQVVDADLPHSRCRRRRPIRCIRLLLSRRRAPPPAGRPSSMETPHCGGYSQRPVSAGSWPEGSGG